jgi:sigma-B regulation protein RsbU (phosphoserine phosphatase)
MLVALLSSQYDRFAALAEAWLAQGAAAFGIFQDGRPLVYWPAGHRLARPSLLEPILHGGNEVGELRIAGVSGSAGRGAPEGGCGADQLYVAARR